MATWAQRLASVQVLMRAGRGLVAFPRENVDRIVVKDPDYAPNSDGVGHGPEPGQGNIVVWAEYEGGSAEAAYGL